MKSVFRIPHKKISLKNIYLKTLSNELLNGVIIKRGQPKTRQNKTKHPLFICIFHLLPAALAKCIPRQETHPSLATLPHPSPWRVVTPPQNGGDPRLEFIHNFLVLANFFFSASAPCQRFVKKLLDYSDKSHHIRIIRKTKITMLECQLKPVQHPKNLLFRDI